MNSLKENRVVIVQVHPDFIITMLNMMRNPVRFLQLSSDRLPDDCYVVSVHSNWQNKRIELLVTSSQFDAVPEGQIPPIWKSDVTRIVDLKEIAKRIGGTEP